MAATLPDRVIHARAPIRVNDTGEQRAFALSTERSTIGRSSDCDLHLDANGVSRHHACLYNTDGTWRIQDLSSANGTLVNGRPIDDHALAPGDAISIGDVNLVFESESEEPAVPVAEFATDEPTATVTEETAPAPVAVATVAAPLNVPSTPEPVAVSREVHADEVQAIVQRMAENTKRIEAEISKAIIGQKEVIWQLLTAIVSNGHVLMIGMPGLAKTMTIRTLSEVLDLKFRRIQFTPDLMPSDITGTDVLEVDEKTGHKEYRFIQGPIFCNIMLADEINRTPPKTQAALLEAMQEHQVTAAGLRHVLEEPFFVLATQNPIEMEGTYPLPEAQLDRFMFSLYLDYPAKAEEIEIVKRTTLRELPTLTPTVAVEDLLRVQQLVLAAPVSDHVIDYAVSLASATRPANPKASKMARDFVEWGAGPRASQYLILGAKALALLNGKISPETADVREVAMSVLQHRVITNYRATGAGKKSRDIVQSILTEVKEESY